MFHEYVVGFDCSEVKNLILFNFRVESLGEAERGEKRVVEMKVGTRRGDPNKHPKSRIGLASMLLAYFCFIYPP